MVARPASKGLTNCKQPARANAALSSLYEPWVLCSSASAGHSAANRWCLGDTANVWLELNSKRPRNHNISRWPISFPFSRVQARLIDPRTRQQVQLAVTRTIKQSEGYHQCNAGKRYPLLREGECFSNMLINMLIENETNDIEEISFAACRVVADLDFDFENCFSWSRWEVCSTDVQAEAVRRVS